MSQEKCQEVKKMKQGMSYSCKEKTIILNVFKYLKNVNPEKSITEIVRRTAKATGCSEKSVFQFRKEEASVEGFKEPSKKKIRKNINANSRIYKYDEQVRQNLRYLISDLKSRHIIPSLGVILKNVNADDCMPNFSLMTLRRLLFDMGYTYEKEKHGSKAILVEKSEIGTRKDSKMLPKRNHSDIQSMEQDLVQNITREMPKQLPQPPQVPQPVQNTLEVSHNQLYMPPQTNRVLGPNPHHYENHIIDPRMEQIHLQHNMIMNRLPHHSHQIHHPVGHSNMGFMPHGGGHPHGIMQQ